VSISFIVTRFTSHYDPTTAAGMCCAADTVFLFLRHVPLQLPMSHLRHFREA